MKLKTKINDDTRYTYNKSLNIIKIIGVIILLAGFITFTSCASNKIEYQLNTDDIMMIEFYDASPPESILEYRLNIEEDYAQINEFTKEFNNSKKYTDDAGTTHPKQAKIILNDGKEINLWYGTQGFIAVSDGEEQFNMKNKNLERMMDSLDYVSRNPSLGSFTFDTADSIDISFFGNDEYYFNIHLEKNDNAKEIKKLLELLEPESNTYIENLGVIRSNIILINGNGGFYSFTFDDEYVTYTGEPFSSYFERCFKDISVKNPQLIEYINALFEMDELVTIKKIDNEPESSIFTFKQLLGVNISDTNKIEIDYRGHITSIDYSEHINIIIDNLRCIQLQSAEYSYGDAEHIYRVNLINNDESIAEFFMDITAEWIGVEGEYYTLVESGMHSAKNVLDTYISYGRDPAGLTEDIAEIMIDAKDNKVVTEAKFYWSYYPLLEDKLEDLIDNQKLDNWGNMEKDLSDYETHDIIMTLINSDYELVDAYTTINTDFRISIKYSDHSRIVLNLSDSEVYMNLWQNNEWLFRTKVLNSEFHECLLQMVDESLEPFPFDIITGIDSATIYYVKAEDKKDFQENGKISKIEITDKTILESIQIAWLDSAIATITYPSRENSDIVFHTSNGDYYGKIKFPITEEEDETEPTIIMEGFFWYQCDELYRILGEIANIN